MSRLTPGEQRLVPSLRESAGIEAVLFGSQTTKWSPVPNTVVREPFFAFLRIRERWIRLTFFTGDA